MKQIQEEMKPGVKYQGYGIINEFGEFQFIPTQKGANEGRLKLVKQGGGWTLHTTADNIIIHLKFQRQNEQNAAIWKFLEIVKDVVSCLREYNLSKESKKKKK